MASGYLRYSSFDDDAANLLSLFANTAEEAAAIELGGVSVNTLHFTPNNFHQPITIHLPTTTANDISNASLSSSSLPVCSTCKKNCKTRDVCRITFGHTGVPWTNCYICVTVDESCIAIDDDGRGHGGYKKEKLLHAVVISPPDHTKRKRSEKRRRRYEVQTYLDVDAPVCTMCKQSKRTKSYCRKKFRHKALPWNTLFVLLKPRPSSPSSTLATATAATAVVDDHDSNDNNLKEVEENGHDYLYPFQESSTKEKDDGDGRRRRRRRSDDDDVMSATATATATTTTTTATAKDTKEEEEEKTQQAHHNRQQQQQQQQYC